MRTTRKARAVTVALALGTGTLLASGGAWAASTNCSVDASVGYVNCLSVGSPTSEGVKAYHSAGLPYRFQLVRSSPAAQWGYWQYSDLDYHFIGLNVSGTITGQVDNRGSANPAMYWVELQ